MPVKYVWCSHNTRRELWRREGLQWSSWTDRWKVEHRAKDVASSSYVLTAGFVEVPLLYVRLLGAT